MTTTATMNGKKTKTKKAEATTKASTNKSAYFCNHPKISQKFSDSEKLFSLWLLILFFYYPKAPFFLKRKALGFKEKYSALSKSAGVNKGSLAPAARKQ